MNALLEDATAIILFFTNQRSVSVSCLCNMVLKKLSQSGYQVTSEVIMNLISDLIVLHRIDYEKITDTVWRHRSRVSLMNLLSDDLKLRAGVLLDKYSSGDWLYPGVLHQDTGCDVFEIYDVLSLLANYNIVEVWYEQFCSCGHMRFFVPSFNNVKMSFVCEKCGKNEWSLYNTTKLYRMLCS